MDLTHWREDYTKNNLKEESIPTDPFLLFNTWFDDAVKDGIGEPNAMTIATISEENKPSARIVLLKEILDEKIIFYTNYESKKGHDISFNENVSILFYWDKSQRQVRMQGKAKKIEHSKSAAYFSSRPIESQISAIASPQSKRIHADELLQMVERVDATQSYSCPEHWGGYAVEISEFEFWQGQPGRLHDRIVFKKTGSVSWEIYRLAP